MVLAIRLLAMAEELDGKDHDVISEVAGQLAVGGESARPEWLAGIMLPAVTQFMAPEEGTYMIEVEIDASDASLPIHVVRGLPGEQ